MPSPNAPSVDRMLRWLQSPAVIESDGGVRSWDNPDRPGYRYPEIAGLLLSLLAQEASGDDQLLVKIKQGLIRDVSARGGVGKDGREYVFDTAMVLSGVLASDRAGESLPSQELPSDLFRFICRLLGAREGIYPPEATEPRTHWSRSYGCHLLKTVLALSAYHDRVEDPLAIELVSGLLDDLLPLHEDGRFRIHAGSSESYLHANCYAIEGLLHVRQLPLENQHYLPIEQCATWLARQQQPEGGIRAWHDGTRGYGDCHADVCAQAVRIWTLVDRAGFELPIARALEFLAGLQTRDGGLKYRPGSSDVNTWATIFAVQAMRLANEPSDQTLLV